jgi:hypothetical protein
VISIVHAMRGHLAENLVALVNQTTKRTLIVGAPGEKAGEQAFAIGCASGLATLFVLSAAGAPIAVGFILGVLVFGALVTILPEQFKPRHELAPLEQASLLQTTTLLEQKAALAGRISQIEADRREKIAIRDKLVALQKKMLAVGSELYQTRIDRIHSAIPLIDKQIALDEELLGVSTKMLTMVEIEIESASAARAIPDDVAMELEARSQEVSELNARVNDLQILLSANEEVERLLRGE